jgi:predicted DNA-binding protein
MEVQFSPEHEARLHDLANRIGREPAQLVVEAVDRALEYTPDSSRQSRKAEPRPAVANCSNMLK